MLRLQNLQMQALDADAQARGTPPAYGEPRDYFSPNQNDADEHQETAA